MLVLVGRWKPKVEKNGNMLVFTKGEKKTENL